MQKQAGNSIVSLMIAITISLLGFTASFVLFTQMLTIDSQQTQRQLVLNKHDALRSKIEMDIMNAGFGLDATSINDHLFISNVNRLTKIHWRYKDLESGNVVCEGIEDLRERIHGLWWRVVSVNC